MSYKFMMVDISSHVYKKFFLQKLIIVLLRKVETPLQAFLSEDIIPSDIHTPKKIKLKNLPTNPQFCSRFPTRIWGHIKNISHQKNSAKSRSPGPVQCTLM
jgi:hypothetical protein